MKCPMDRRAFLKRLGLAAGGVAMGSTPLACARSGGGGPAPKVSGMHRVALATDAGVRTAQGLNASRVVGMLDRVLRDAFGSPDAASGLRSIAGEGDVVGLKLNCLAGRPLSTTRELVDALIRALQRAGVPQNRIILFERGERDLRKGGFEVRHTGAPLALGNDSPGVGYEERVETSGMVGACLSRLVTRRISVLINVGVLKDHNLAGVSAGLKNLFGIIHNPNRYHDNACDPFVADVLAYPVVQRKLKLTVVDALTAQYEGGPGWVPKYAWQFNGLMASTDPVALDRLAWKLIEQKRSQKGLPSLAEQKRDPRWLRTAAQRKLGVDDLERIQVLRRG